MTFGAPSGAAAWGALALSVVCLALGKRLLDRAPSRVFVAIAALVAALISAAYVVVYLRGGPRIIDATTYFLEGRALAEGKLAWPLDEPVTSTVGRFLVRGGTPDAPTAQGIFPPGYPALLAVGFLLHAPMAMGPLLAAALVLITFDLAKRLGATPQGAWIAAILSVICAALRYHTADTMSHGLAAVTFCGALTLTLRAREDRSVVASIGAGVLFGWLVATRPVSALALAITLVVVVLRAPRASLRESARLVALIALGALPGVVLLALHARAATGSLTGSAQLAYYAASDGPPGCFRWGFGRGIGCLLEHGDFVRKHLDTGYGWRAALGTTGRRLRAHLVDAGNVELFFPLVVCAATRKKTRLPALALVAQVLAYAPFYFDGNYPAGGARFFADVLPIEHAIVGILLADLAARRAWIPSVAVALALAGFAFRGSYDHASLRDREGGAPMFEPRVLEAANIRSGMVFFDTDHGFNLAFDPDPSAPIRAARYKGDALDRFAWERAGKPPSFRYRYDFSTGHDVTPFDPSASPNVIEAESLWPPRAQSGGYAEVIFASGTCASNERLLLLQGKDAVTVTLDLPAAVGGFRVRPGFLMRLHGVGTVRLLQGKREVALWASPDASDTLGCTVGAWSNVLPSQPMTLEISGSGVGLDRLELDR
jgi:hypothetical protein